MFLLTLGCTAAVMMAQISFLFWVNLQVLTSYLSAKCCAVCRAANWMTFSWAVSAGALIITTGRFYFQPVY